MAATSLKLPDGLKRRIERLAVKSKQTPHAFMIEAIAREADLAERRERFAADAAQAEKEMLASGKGHDLATAFDYLERRLEDSKARRPRARKWRVSK